MLVRNEQAWLHSEMVRFEAKIVLLLYTCRQNGWRKCADGNLCTLMSTFSGQLVSLLRVPFKLSESSDLKRCCGCRLFESSDLKRWCGCVWEQWPETLMWLCLKAVTWNVDVVVFESSGLKHWCGCKLFESSDLKQWCGCVWEHWPETLMWLQAVWEGAQPGPGPHASGAGLPEHCAVHQPSWGRCQASTEDRWGHRQNCTLCALMCKLCSFVPRFCCDFS